MALIQDQGLEWLLLQRGLRQVVNGSPVLALHQDFQGTDGTAVTVANSGSASGDALDFVSASGVVYDVADLLVGVSCVKASVAAGTTASARWTTSFGTRDAYFARDYFRLKNLPGAGPGRFFQQQAPAGNVQWGLAISVAGALTVRDLAAGIDRLVTGVSPTLDTWHRVEWWTGKRDDGLAQVRVRLFLDANLHGTVPDFEGVSTRFTQVDSAASYNVGVHFSASDTWDVCHAGLVLRTDDWPGPLVLPSGPSGSAVGEQRTGGTTTGTKQAIGTAQGGQRVAGQTTGAKGAAGAALGEVRTAGLTAGRKQALGSTVGEQRSSGLATRAGAATGAATGQQRVTGTTTGAKGTAAGGSGQQRTAGQVAVRKQALAGVSSAQRTTGTTTVRKQAFGATVGQQRVAGSATRAVLAVWFRPPTFKQYFDGPGFGVLMGRVPFDAAYGVLDDGSACSPFPGRQVLFQDEEEAAVRVYTGGSVHGPLTPEEVGRLVAAGYGPSPGPYLSTTPP